MTNDIIKLQQELELLELILNETTDLLLIDSFEVQIFFKREEIRNNG